MSEYELRYPKLDKFYQRFLAEEDSARFVQEVSDSYTLGTLERLARFGGKISRRASVLAIGFLGDFALNEVMGLALSDSDRAVRLLADHNIRQIWMRQGTDNQHQYLEKLERLNNLDRTGEVIELATSLIQTNKNLGEAWNQRAIAYCNSGEFDLAIMDCKETLNCNRYHFPAAMGMGHCCLQMDDAFSALDCFRLALNINPDLESLRGQIRHLEQILDGPNS